jgi:hypothetical protein
MQRRTNEKPQAFIKEYAQIATNMQHLITEQLCRVPVLGAQMYNHKYILQPYLPPA